MYAGEEAVINIDEVWYGLLVAILVNLAPHNIPLVIMLGLPWAVVFRGVFLCHILWHWFIIPCSLLVDAQYGAQGS